MRSLAIILLSCALIFPAFTQTTKPKKAEASKTAKKSTPAKPTSAKAKPKSTPAKATAAKVKPKATPAKPTAAKAKLKSTPAKATAAKAKPKSAPTKATASKPKPTLTPVKAPDENAEWEKAAALTDAVARIAALRAFVKTFPKSERTAQAAELIVTTGANFGNEKLRAGDTAAAAAAFTRAVKDVPVPIADQLFKDVLSKFPGDLFRGGERVAAFEIARMLEDKCAQNAAQLLGIANFYMSIENGGEARRVAEFAIRNEPGSAAAYLTLGLANRMDFRLDDSAAAYAKALEFDPASMPARRGLAEMKRALGRADEAAGLYREILAGDEANLPARTGLILALFESGKRAEAEIELTRSLDANPGNVVLLAGAAYWYASQKEGPKAIELAQRAIATEPRFIWSHIALARGFMMTRRPLDAERTLIAARRYGNFPTLEYEIASARVMAGFYREAADEMAKSFSIKDGKLVTKLGGRIEAESADFITLLARERQASIAAPTAADSAENARQLRSLLELSARLAANDSDSSAVSAAAVAFAGGDDGMRVYRQLFAARELLNHKQSLATALDLVRDAVGRDDAGLDVPTPSTAVMADELYESRRLAISRNEYLRAPDVPRQTLSAILRGRIEEISGWALYQTNDAAQAVIRLKRAVSVLPVDSVWWRSSMWRLGTALDADNKSAEALEAYAKSYKSGQPDAVSYSIIKALYARINGSLDGIENKVGANPAPETSPDAEAKKAESVPLTETTANTAASPTPTPAINEATSVPPKGTEKAKAAAEPSPSPEIDEKKTEPVAEPTPVEVKSPTPTPEPATSPTPKTTDVVTEPPPIQIASEKPTAKDVSTVTDKTQTVNELFPPVVITIPSQGKETPSKPVDPKPDAPTEQKAAAPEVPNPGDAKTPETTAGEQPAPCSITLSEKRLTLESSGADRAVIVGTDEAIDLSTIKATSSSPSDVSVRVETIIGGTGRALFVVRSASKKKGLFQIVFKLPCGKKELAVIVR